MDLRLISTDKAIQKFGDWSFQHASGYETMKHYETINGP